MSWYPYQPDQTAPSTWPYQPSLPAPSTVWYPQPTTVVVYHVDEETKAIMREIRDLLKEVLKGRKESEK